MIHSCKSNSVIVSDTPGFIEHLSQHFPYTQIMQFEAFIPNGTPVVFALQCQNIASAGNMFRKIDARVRARSIITGRLAQGESAPQNLPRNTVFIPWCDDETYKTWLQFHLSFSGIVPSLNWLFAHNSSVVERDDIRRFNTIIHNLSTHEICELDAKLLAHKYPCSRTSLAHYCRVLYGVPAGTLCRVWRVFTRTAEFMREEQLLLPDGRYGHSPIGCLEGDYLNSLERVIGMRYTDLRLAAQEEHWVAVWMRRWRRKMANLVTKQ